VHNGVFILLGFIYQTAIGARKLPAFLRYFGADFGSGVF
jgi:hypothetical protein